VAENVFAPFLGNGYQIEGEAPDDDGFFGLLKCQIDTALTPE